MTRPSIRRFEASAGGQIRWPGGAARCVFGRSGAIAPSHKREGDGATPLGLWPMREVFWRPDRLEAPVTQLTATALTPGMGWCDDPASPHYNQRIALPFPASHEHLWRDDALYDLIVVLGYNDAPAIPDKGSAIFLHCARPDFTPTEGCVACQRDDLLALLAAAEPGDTLVIAP